MALVLDRFPFAACGPVVRVRVVVCLHIVQVLIYGAVKKRIANLLRSTRHERYHLLEGSLRLDLRLSLVDESSVCAQNYHRGP
jgi:hypothetical protein